MMFDDKGRLVVSLEATAADIDIVDAGGHYAAVEVESALQELGHLTSLTVAEVDQLENIGVNAITVAIWGYVAGLTTHPLGADGTAGRIPRGIRLTIKDGTNAATLKCSTGSRWNGDVIAETDNIAKDATTGNFSLNAAGTMLTIENSGLSGNVFYAISNINNTDCGTIITTNGAAFGNDIILYLPTIPTGVANDITTLVNTGDIVVEIFYITDA